MQLIVATAVAISSLTLPDLKRVWDFGWRGGKMFVPAEGWSQIMSFRQAIGDDAPKKGRTVRCGARGMFTTNRLAI